jgi:hypothetical protein
MKRSSMKRTHIMMVLLGSALVLQAASTSTNVSDQSKQASRLLREIKADAVQIRSDAAQLNTIAANSNTTWMDYDHQWNVLKPCVEDMQMKLARLERIQSSLSATERTELDQVKPLVGEIQTETHQFLALLDQPGVQTSDSHFKVYASSLRSEANKLQTVVPVS